MKTLIKKYLVCIHKHHIINGELVRVLPYYFESDELPYTNRRYNAYEFSSIEEAEDKILTLPENYTYTIETIYKINIE